MDHTFYPGMIAAAVAVMLVAGMLGGAINILQARKDDEPKPKHDVYYALLSTAAAFSVPLFLSLTKSELLKKMLVISRDESVGEMIENWFIFFAACLVAAIYARLFLESVSKKLIDRVERAEETAKEAKQEASEAKSEVPDAAVDAFAEQVESSPTTSATEDQASAAAAELERARAVAEAKPKVDINRYDQRVRKVIAALQASQYSLRSPTGIARDAGLTREETRNILKRLINDGVVLETVGPKTGRVLYMLRLDALTGI